MEQGINIIIFRFSNVKLNLFPLEYFFLGSHKLVEQFLEGQSQDPLIKCYLEHFKFWEYRVKLQFIAQICFIFIISERNISGMVEKS